VSPTGAAGLTFTGLRCHSTHRKKWLILRRGLLAGGDSMIRVGIGGWTFAPWRETFYPQGLKHADELNYASRHVTTIEINGTFYRTQSAASFRKWRDDTPDDFVFTVKGHRAIVNSRKLGDAGEAIAWFFKSGILELGPKLGPILWQLAPFKRFDRDDLGAFLSLLPRQSDGQPIKHVLEVRHESFAVPEFVSVLRDQGIAVVYADSDDYPAIADATGDVIYARLQRADEKHKTGYAPAELDKWAERVAAWAKGSVPADLHTVAKPSKSKTKRDVFVFMINGFKPHAPAAAMALIGRLKPPK
jgi:uncharacterized protein YecE (DUF72 family)